MISAISYNDSKASKFINDSELSKFFQSAIEAKKTLDAHTGAGNDFLGWLDLPVNYDVDEFARIKKSADKIRKDSDVLIVIGIGGSYLGAKAAIDFIGQTRFGKNTGKSPEIIFAGNSISQAYLTQVIESVEGRDFSVNVISKSGTTTEPAIAFRVFKKLAEKKYGKAEAAKRIYATTDKARGALKKLADAQGYETFVVPDDVGGRFSVLTAVGLLPIAVSGADIDALMKGAADMRELSVQDESDKNVVLQYAAARNYFLSKGFNIEVFANYEPRFHFVAEWLKQLYGESEGKDKKGIFPASVDLTTDLHSMGQYLQDGQRILFETVLDITQPDNPMVLEAEDEDLDGLNYLAGKTVDFVNKNAMEGTLLAHTDGGVPCGVVSINKADEYNLGALFYFFEYACGISGYMLGVNPFNQPGVEMYKTNMFALLGKPGYSL